jgi:hypothetical protein
MLVLQAVPSHGIDAYRVLRACTCEASRWGWANEARTFLKHVNRLNGGYIRIADASSVLVAHIPLASPRDCNGAC